MRYLRFKVAGFFEGISTEAEARALFWLSKFNGLEFVCPHCQCERFYEFKARPEVRRCRACQRNVRLRAGTMLEHSKKSLLVWARTLFLMMQDKRGVSALHVKRELGLPSYGTVWNMLHKIRRALAQRDANYRISGKIELDGARFGSEAPLRKGRRPSGQRHEKRVNTKVLVAVESKTWVDDKGRIKESAGFAKIELARETSIFSRRFAAAAIESGSNVNTDGGPAFAQLNQLVELKQKVMNQQPQRLDTWLPWVHRFISNAKTWLMGTHHAVKAKYLAPYLAEYTYRFNRRHDPDGLFHRALTACMLATPVRLWALSG